MEASSPLPRHNAEETPPGMLAAIETLLKEHIHPEVRRYLRGLYLDATEKKVTT